MADEYIDEISDLALLDFRVFFEDEESEKKEEEEESKEDTKDGDDGVDEASEGTSSGNDQTADKSNNSVVEKEEEREPDILPISFPFDERFKLTEDYETLASMMRALLKQKEQAERDLEILRVEKERALEDPASFVEDLMQKKGDRLPKRQAVAKLPKIDINKYNRLRPIPTVKEEPANGSTVAGVDPNAPAHVNGTAPTLEAPVLDAHQHGHDGTAHRDHDPHAHHDESHLHVNGIEHHALSTSELNGHDAHVLPGLNDKALLDAVNLLNESAQDITLESGSIHPINHTPSNTSVPNTPAAPSTSATDPAPTTPSVTVSNNNAAPTSTTPAQPSTAPQTVPQVAAQTTAQPNGTTAPGAAPVTAPVTAPTTGEVKEKKKVFNRLWTPEEQRKLERLLEEYPEEIIQSHRWEKIARALGNRSPKQVASRVQKYFIKLAKAGLPVPGKIPNLESKKKPSAKPIPPVEITNPHIITIHTRNVEYYVPPVVKMDEDDEVPVQPVITVPGKTVPRKRKAESGTGEDEDRNKKPKIKEEPINGGREIIIRVVNQPEAVHLGYKCDSCGLEPIVGPRWSCEDCTGDNSVDLCKICIGKKFETKWHKKGHKMRKIEEVEKSPYYVADGTQAAGDLSNFEGLPYLDPNYMPV